MDHVLEHMSFSFTLEATFIWYSLYTASMSQLESGSQFTLVQIELVYFYTRPDFKLTKATTIYEAKSFDLFFS